MTRRALGLVSLLVAVLCACGGQIETENTSVNRAKLGARCDAKGSQCPRHQHCYNYERVDDALRDQSFCVEDPCGPLTECASGCAIRPDGHQVECSRSNPE